MTSSNAVSEFWNLFVESAVALSQLNTADDPLYIELLEKLKEINSALFFEFSTQPENCELIITAEGDRDLFACVEDIVSAAPKVNGWTIFALKPKLGFPKTTTWEGYEISIADVVFEPLKNKTNDLGLRLFISGLNELDVEHAHQGLLRAIDHGLGEREFAESIQYIEVVALNESSSKYIPLTELEKYIQWRKKL